MIAKEFPTLYGESSKGKCKQYRIWIEQHPNNTASIFREHGQMDGKKQLDEKVIATGKNIGKANETSPVDQAISEAESMWKKKKDNNYIEDLSKIGDKVNLLPMLAQPFKDYKHKLRYPLYGQPKLNGVRCLTKNDGDIDFISRKGKSYNETLQHLVEAAKSIIPPGEIFDGEVYIHGLPLQTIVSYVKRLQEASASLQLCIYDVADTTKPFKDRYEKYFSCIPENHPQIIKVPCVIIEKEEDIKKYHDLYVQEGFEGLILRNFDGMYVFDYRSYDLQKYKEFKEEEFEIIGGRTAESGRYAGSCVYLCKTKEDKPFEVCPKGTMKERQKAYQDLPNNIGKKYTVRFFEYTPDGIPLHGIGICIRDYE
ncbi:MAG: hypothetical protein WC511_01720 [Candidatus Pacearchaeota archaeon]